MAGKRHHFIPQFLLKGFVSSRRSGVLNVWMYRKDQRGIELNIENVGVEKHFYGKPEESNLDERITSLESDLAKVTDDLRSHSTLESRVQHPGLPYLIAHLSLRTRQVRQSIQSIMDSTLSGLKEHLNQREVLTAMMARELGRQGDVRRHFEQFLVDNGVPPGHIEAAMENLQPHWREVAEELLAHSLPEFSERLDVELNVSRSVVPAALRSGFIDSMSRNLDAQERVARYETLNWFLLRVATPVILGDAVCIFETRGDRRFKPLDVDGDDVQRIYLPLSAERVLVGTPYTSCPRVDPRVLNKAIARCSQDFFVSSIALPEGSSLIEGIGKWSGLLNRDQIQELVEEVKQGLVES